MITVKSYREGDEDGAIFRPDDRWGVDDNDHLQLLMVAAHPSWTFWLGGKPVMLMGAWPLWRGCWETWAMPTDSARGHAVAVVRATIDLHEDFCERPDVKRINAIVREDKVEYMKWLELLGYSREYVIPKAYDGRLDVYGYRYGRKER